MIKMIIEVCLKFSGEIDEGVIIFLRGSGVLWKIKY